MAEILTALSYRFLIFSDDWGRHPSSCQYLVRELLPRHEVAWVDTIGMRTPGWNWGTVQRGLEKLRQWSRGRAADVTTPENLTLLRPAMWPWFSRAWDRGVNRRLLENALAAWCGLNSDLATAVTTLPIVADLMGTLPVERWVYYCVDDFSQWPGVDQRAMLEMERAVIDKADVIIAASRHLQDRIARHGRESHLLIHGVDVDFWRNASSSEIPPELADCERPWIVFWGLVDRRMDVTFVQRLSESLDRGSIALIGPEADPDPQLAAIPRVRRVPSQTTSTLAAIGQTADVLIMPYADQPVTQAMQPLKMLEYLATGLPVVVRDLPATRDWSDCLDAASTADTFAAAVLNRIAGGMPPEQLVARKRLAAESWSAKALQFAEWIAGPASARR